MTNPKCKVCGAPELATPHRFNPGHTFVSDPPGHESVSDAALEMAEAAYREDSTYTIAAALQKLMDERDALGERYRQCIHRAEASDRRAEAAEKNAANYREQWDNEKHARCLLETECGDAQERAEAAEKALADLKNVNRYQRGYSDGQREERTRAEQAEEQWAIMRKLHAEQFDRAEAAEDRAKYLDERLCARVVEVDGLRLERDNYKAASYANYKEWERAQERAEAAELLSRERLEQLKYSLARGRRTEVAEVQARRVYRWSKRWKALATNYRAQDTELHERLWRAENAAKRWKALAKHQAGTMCLAASDEYERKTYGEDE